MGFVKNERKINSLLQQMQQQIGVDEYMQKVKTERKKNEELSRRANDLSKIDTQDPFRITPRINENSRPEREREDLKHRERQKIMRRVHNRQRQCQHQRG